MIRKTLTAFALAAAFAFTMGPAFAQGMFPGYPSASSPLTGNETIPADTNLSGGIAPQTELVTPGLITGLALENPLGRYFVAMPGNVAFAGWGNDTTYVSGTQYVSSILIGSDITLTGIACYNGATVGTDKVIYALWDRDGDLVTNTTTSGTTTSGADAAQEIAFASTQAVKAGLYWVGVQANGTTDNVKTVAASTYAHVATDAITGTFGTLDDPLTVPSTFTANEGPLCYVYGS